MDTKLTDLCFVKKQFLTKEECGSFIDYYENKEKEGIYEMSLDVFDRVRKKASFTVKEVETNTDLYHLIKKKIREALIEYQKHLDSIGIFNTVIGDFAQYSHRYRILKYEEGCSIHTHLDHAYGIYFTLTFNLNTGYEGGKFSFFDRKFQPDLGEGDLMIFPSDIFWNHEVTKLTKGKRYSFNCFLRPIPSEVADKLIVQGSKLHQEYVMSTDPNEKLGPYFPERFRET
jgi:hypothetical protein